MTKSENFNSFFHHIALTTAKYESSVAFYEALGMKRYIEWTENGYKCCFLNMGNGPFLELHGTDSAEPISPEMHLCLHVDDVDAFYALALSKGAQPWRFEPFNCPLTTDAGRVINARIAFFKAPGGEAVEIIKWEDYRADAYERFSGRD